MTRLGRVVTFPRTSIVLAAGLGTRFLPTTKSVPKELLPLVDIPGIELVAQEVAQAGSEQLLIVTSPSKSAIVNYFQPQPQLEETLAKAGKHALIAKIQRAPQLVNAVMVEQNQPLGIGHAVGCTEHKLTSADDAVAVLLPDDLILPMGILEKMEKVRQQYGGSVLCAFRAPEDQLSSYGVFEVADVQQFPGEDFTVARVVSMVEKPQPSEAPSQFAAAGRYLLDREIYDAIKNISPGSGGEYQLTDAIDYLIRKGHPVHVVVHEGKRHDTGNPLGYIKAVIDFALERDDISGPLRTWLIETLDC